MNEQQITVQLIDGTAIVWRCKGGDITGGPTDTARAVARDVFAHGVERVEDGRAEFFPPHCIVGVSASPCAADGVEAYRAGLHGRDDGGPTLNTPEPAAASAGVVGRLWRRLKVGAA